MGEQKTYKTKRENGYHVKKIKLDLYRTQKETVQEPENQSLIILSIN